MIFVTDMPQSPLAIVGNLVWYVNYSTGWMLSFLDNRWCQCHSSERVWPSNSVWPY